MGITASLFRSNEEAVNDGAPLASGRTESAEEVAEAPWRWSPPFPLTANESNNDRVRAPFVGTLGRDYVSPPFPSGPWSIVREPGVRLSVTRDGLLGVGALRPSCWIARRSERPNSHVAAGAGADHGLDTGLVADLFSKETLNPSFIDLLQTNISDRLLSSREAVSPEAAEEDSFPAIGGVTHEETLLALLLQLIWAPHGGQLDDGRISQASKQYAMDGSWSPVCPSLTRQDVWMLCNACLEASLSAPCVHHEQARQHEIQYPGEKGRRTPPILPQSGDGFEQNLVSEKARPNHQLFCSDHEPNGTAKLIGPEAKDEKDETVAMTAGCFRCYCLRKRFLLRLRRDVAVTRWLLLLFSAKRSGVLHRLPSWVASVPLLIGHDSLGQIERVLSLVLGTHLVHPPPSEPLDMPVMHPLPQPRECGAIISTERASSQGPAGGNQRSTSVWNGQTEDELGAQSSTVAQNCPLGERASRKSRMKQPTPEQSPFWGSFHQSCDRLRNQISYDPLQHDLFADGLLSLPFETLFDIGALFQSLVLLTDHRRSPSVLNDPIGREMNPAEGCSLRAHSARQEQMQETQQLALDAREEPQASRSIAQPPPAGPSAVQRPHSRYRSTQSNASQGSRPEISSYHEQALHLEDGDFASRHAHHRRIRDTSRASSNQLPPMPTDDWIQPSQGVASHHHQASESMMASEVTENLRGSGHRPRVRSNPVWLHKRLRHEANEEQNRSLSASKPGRRRTRSLQVTSSRSGQPASDANAQRSGLQASCYRQMPASLPYGDLERLERYVRTLEEVAADLEQALSSRQMLSEEDHRADRYRKSASSPSLSTTAKAPLWQFSPQTSSEEASTSMLDVHGFSAMSRSAPLLMHCFLELVRQGILDFSLYPLVYVLCKRQMKDWTSTNDSQSNTFPSTNLSWSRARGQGRHNASAHAAASASSRGSSLLAPLWLACTASTALQSYWGSLSGASAQLNEDPRQLDQAGSARDAPASMVQPSSGLRFWMRRSTTTSGRGRASPSSAMDVTTNTETIFVEADAYKSSGSGSVPAPRGYTIVYRCRMPRESFLPCLTGAESPAERPWNKSSPTDVGPRNVPAGLHEWSPRPRHLIEALVEAASSANGSVSCAGQASPLRLTRSPTDGNGAALDACRSPTWTASERRPVPWSPMTHDSDSPHRAGAWLPRPGFDHHDHPTEEWMSPGPWSRSASLASSPVTVAVNQHPPTSSLETNMPDPLEIDRDSCSPASVSTSSWWMLRADQRLAQALEGSPHPPLVGLKSNELGADPATTAEQGSHPISLSWQRYRADLGDKLSLASIRIRPWSVNAASERSTGATSCAASPPTSSLLCAGCTHAQDAFSAALFASGAYQHPRIRALIRNQVAPDTADTISVLGCGSIPPSLQSLCAHHLVEIGYLAAMERSAASNTATNAAEHAGGREYRSVKRSFQRLTEAANTLIRTGEHPLMLPKTESSNDAVADWVSLPAPILALYWEAALSSGTASPALLRLYAQGVASQVVTARLPRAGHDSSAELLWIRQAPLPERQHFRVPAEYRARFQDEWLLALTPAAAMLECLDLSGCGQVTDRGLVALAPHLRQLRVCVLEGCLGIWGPGIQALLRCCPQLETLRLRGCRSLTDVAFQLGPRKRCEENETFPERRQSARMTLSLTHLDLGECVQLTDDGLLALKLSFDESRRQAADTLQRPSSKTITAVSPGHGREAPVGGDTGQALVANPLPAVAYDRHRSTNEQQQLQEKAAGTLETLSVAHCFRLGDRSLGPFLQQHQSSLRSVNLSHTAITVAILEDLGALDCLQMLSLRGCGENMAVDTTIATRFGEQLALPGKQLSHLDLGNCARLVTDGFLAALAGAGTTATCRSATTGQGASTRDTLRSLSLHACRLTDRSLSHYLRLFRSLERLDLSQCALITDAGVEHLQSLKLLTELNLADTGVTSAVGTTLLCRLSQLRRLDLSYTAIHNSVTKSLSTLEHLEWLSLDARFISDDALQVLETEASHSFDRACSTECVADASVAFHLRRRIGLPRQLRHLDVFSAHVTDRGIAYLVQACPFLETLEVCSGALTDAALRLIAQHLPWLRSLNLSQNMRISDAGLREVAKLAQLQRDLGQPLLLQSLNVAFTAVTWRGLAALLPALPHLRLLCVRGCNKDAFSAATVQSLERIRPGLVILGAGVDASANGNHD